MRASGLSHRYRYSTIGAVPDESPLGEAIHLLQWECGDAVRSRKRLSEVSAHYGDGRSIARTTLERWETDPHVEPDAVRLQQLAELFDDILRRQGGPTKRSYTQIMGMLFTAAGKTPPEEDTLAIRPSVLARLGPGERKLLEDMAERLARLRSGNVRDGREIGRAGEALPDDLATDGEDAGATM